MGAVCMGISKIYISKIFSRILNKMQIANITATATLSNSKLNLRHIASLFPNCTLSTKAFKALKIKAENGTTGLLYESGKIVLVGAKCLTMTLNAVNDICECLNHSVCPRGDFFVKDFSVQNIVGAATFYPIDLGLLYANQAQNCCYDQENFAPALKFKLRKNERPIALIFHTGKVIITGTRTCEEINELYYYLKRMLLRYKK